MHRWRRSHAVLALSLSACGPGESDIVIASADRIAQACTSEVIEARTFGSDAGMERYRLRVRIPAAAHAFALIAHDRRASTSFARLVDPDGFPIDLILDEELRKYRPAAMAALYGVPVEVDRLLMPPNPSLRYLAKTGEWEVFADANRGRFCLSALVTETPGTRLRLDVYAVGLEGVTSAQLATDEDWLEVLGVATDIWERIGVQIEDIRYVTAGAVDGARFGVVSRWLDFADLVAISEPASSAVEDRLRVPVFLVRGFAGEVGAAGLIGLSTGIPGAIGLHGTSDSGIVFAAEEYLGGPDVTVEHVGTSTGNAFLGAVLAHELGHFLGLFHTTELFGGDDRLDDTPACAGLAALPTLQASRCNDASNLMFPLALPGAEALLTPMQLQTVQANPLLRP